MNIRFAEIKDIDLLIRYDKHIAKEEIRNIIRQSRIYIVEKDSQFVGWLRYNLFWDNTPFINMLYILEEYRGRGFGRQAVEFWENEMRQQGYHTFMTSTQADEYAQHFYFRLGYEAAGGFRLGNDPYEIIFSKSEMSDKHSNGHTDTPPGETC